MAAQSIFCNGTAHWKQSYGAQLVGENEMLLPHALIIAFISAETKIWHERESPAVAWFYR